VNLGRVDRWVSGHKEAPVQEKGEHRGHSGPTLILHPALELPSHLLPKLEMALDCCPLLRCRLLLLLGSVQILTNELEVLVCRTAYRLADDVLILVDFSGLLLKPL